MKNISNTAYINSSLQILIHIPQFINIIRRNNHFKKDVIYYINKIFDLILNKSMCIDPTDFIRYFIENNPKYNEDSQHNSKLFLEDLINNISSELSSLKFERKLYHISDNSKKKKEFFEYLKKSDKDTYFEINDLFYVYFIYIKICRNCNFKSHYFDKTFGIKLNFRNINKKIDLHSLLRENFSENYSEIKCQYCNYDKVMVKARIAKFPKILIFKFQNDNNKNIQMIPVQYSQTIGIREFFDLDLCNDSSRYELFVFNHFFGNSPSSGHYISTILFEKINRWYSFNDDYVELTIPNKGKYDILSNNSTIFYKQKNYN